MPGQQPSRGEVWLVSLDPTQGHEQGGTRPALIISVNKFNHGPAGLVVIAPMTTKDKRIASHVKVPKGEAGTTADCFVKCEEVRCVSKGRLKDYWGDVKNLTMEAVEQRVRVILGL